MMRQYELVERVTAYDANADEALLNRAYVYAMKAHGAQKRASGDPYFSHPLEVAAILTEHKLDDATIAAALLHDTVEDTDATLGEINDAFGGEIGALVDGLTKISRLDLISREAAQAENLRKLLLAVSDDVRVLMVKLADRLHNMRTLEHVPPEKRARIAQETMDIYAPLAGRMGMQEMRDELEDLSFRILNKEASDIIDARLKVLHSESGNIIAEIEQELTRELKEHGIDADVHGREKKPYSIWGKMERKSISLGQLSDIYGFRVIVPTIDECYRALGVVHQTWRMVPGRFKDYISTPKQNDYQSVHTTVIGPHHKRVELQIRTAEMHEVAERGIAAHALYKDAVNGSGATGPVPLSEESNVYRWLRQLVEMISEGDNSKEFLEHTKLQLFYDQVFCFTPKGHLISLPRGATPIDFAYAVHTDIGNSCVGCNINGTQAPLIGELENGDEVEVICSKAQVPPAGWEQIAVTGKARAAIRRARREAVQKQYGSLGAEILDRAAELEALKLEKSDIERMATSLGYARVDDFLTAIGRGEESAIEAVRMLPRPEKAEDAKNLNGSSAQRRWSALGKAMWSRSRRRGGKRDQNLGARAIPIRGLKNNLPVRLAPEIGAVPGERIVGILTPGEGITIYPIHAKKLTEFEDQPDRWLDLTWDVDEDTDDRYPAAISVTVLNDVGTLAQIAQVIGENDGNISNLNMVSREGDFFEMHIDVEVRNLKHLNQIISKVRRKSVVSKVDRLNDD